MFGETIKFNKFKRVSWSCLSSQECEAAKASFETGAECLDVKKAQ